MARCRCRGMFVRSNVMPRTTTDVRHRPAPGQAEPSNWLARSAAWCYDHRRLVRALWIGLLVVASVISGIVGSDDQDRFTGGNAKSQRAIAMGLPIVTASDRVLPHVHVEGHPDQLAGARSRAA
jgi:hypothetical protein